MEPEYKSQHPLYIPYTGSMLLEFSLLNKGSAFTEDERSNFNLHGLLPKEVETIEAQTQRAYQQYQSLNNDDDKYIYLRSIQDTNETLFYRLLDTYLREMMPIIYTPTVGEACKNFSGIYRKARGLFISYPNRVYIDDMLQNATKKNVKVIVVTDGERILGLGDQGIGGMGITIGKLSLYTACAGINPAYTLPVVLDVGTNNEKLKSDPLYMGWKHQRIVDDKYDAFVDLFIQAIKRRWPNVLLQFEDFAQKNATRLLHRYRDELCCFNDDIQGTAAVTLGSLIAASRAAGCKLRDQTIAILGAGSAGCGVAEQIIAQMMLEGLSEISARERIFMIDRSGLMTDKSYHLLDFQNKLQQNSDKVRSWGLPIDNIFLLDVILHAKPTILIGFSGQPGLFSEELIRAMYSYCKRPIIMPLSNPTSRVEALPDDIITWTEGNAIVATGSPFPPVRYKGKLYHIAQCNNSYIFPGIGLGVLASNARKITDGMLMTASLALADFSPLAMYGEGALLPDIDKIQNVSKKIAIQVGKKAQEEGVATRVSNKALAASIKNNYWRPQYRMYKRTSF